MNLRSKLNPFLDSLLPYINFFLLLKLMPGGYLCIVNNMLQFFLSDASTRKTAEYESRVSIYYATHSKMVGHALYETVHRKRIGIHKSSLFLLLLLLFLYSSFSMIHVFYLNRFTSFLPSMRNRLFYD